LTGRHIWLSEPASLAATPVWLRHTPDLNRARRYRIDRFSASV